MKHRQRAKHLRRRNSLLHSHPRLQIRPKKPGLAWQSQSQTLSRTIRARMTTVLQRKQRQRTRNSPHRQRIVVVTTVMGTCFFDAGHLVAMPSCQHPDADMERICSCSYFIKILWQDTVAYRHVLFFTFYAALPVCTCPPVCIVVKRCYGHL